MRSLIIKWFVFIVPILSWVGNVSADQLVVAVLDWGVTDDHYMSHQESMKLTSLLEVELSESGEYDWIDRQTLAEAGEELLLSRAAQDPATWLRVGLWIGADLLVTGRVERISRGWRLHGLVIDVERADVLASWVSKVAGEEGEPLSLAELDVDQWVRDAKAGLVEAGKEYQVSRTQVAAAVLFFENQTGVGRRIDHLENKLDKALEAASATNDRVRLLRFPGAHAATDEYELVLSGLAQGGAEASRRLADVYLWGTYREVEWEGAPFRDVPIEFTLWLWNGQGEPLQRVYRGEAGKMDDLIAQIAAAATAWADTQHQIDTLAYDPSVAKRISKTLIERATRLQMINRGNNRDVTSAFLHRWRKTVRQLEIALFFDPDNASLNREMLAERWRQDLYRNGQQYNQEAWRRAALDADIQHHIDRFGYGTEWPIMFPRYPRGWIADNRFPRGERMSEAAIYSSRDIFRTSKGMLRETPREVRLRERDHYQAITIRRAREVIKTRPDPQSLLAVLNLRHRGWQEFAVEMIELAWQGMGREVSEKDYARLSGAVTSVFNETGNPERASVLLSQLRAVQTQAETLASQRPDPDRVPQRAGPFANYPVNRGRLRQMTAPVTGWPPKRNASIVFLDMPDFDYREIYQVWRQGDAIWVNMNLSQIRSNDTERNTWRYTPADQKWHGTQGWVRVNRWVKQAISSPAFDTQAVWLATDGHSVGRISLDGESRVFGPLSGLTSTRFHAAAATDDRLILAGGEFSERAQLNIFLPGIDDWIAVAVPERSDKALPMVEEIAAIGDQVLLIGDYLGIAPMFLRYDLKANAWSMMRDKWLAHLANAVDAKPMRPEPRPERFNPSVLLGDADSQDFWIGSQAGLTRYRLDDNSFKTWFAQPPSHPNDSPNGQAVKTRHFGSITAMTALPDRRHLIVATESRRGLGAVNQEEDRIGAYLYIFDKVAGEWKGYIQLESYTPVTQLLVDGPTLWMVTDGQTIGIAHLNIDDIILNTR